jgi:hypothetical protein
MTGQRPNIHRTLTRYGISTPGGVLSGTMLRMALTMLDKEPSELQGSQSSRGPAQESRSPISEWAEELAGISYRRNVMERSLRAIVVNFLRMYALNTKDGHLPSPSCLLQFQEKGKLNWSRSMWTVSQRNCFG